MNKLSKMIKLNKCSYFFTEGYNRAIGDVIMVIAENHFDDLSELIELLEVCKITIEEVDI